MQKKRFGVFFAYIGVLLIIWEGNICEATGAGAMYGEVSTAYTYVVAQDGSGDYTTIQEAVDASGSGDVIQIMPGVYYESVRIDGKAITLEGVQRDSCIIQYRGDCYDTPPLDMASGTVRNLTIHAVRPQESASLTHESYAVHIDKEQYDSKVTTIQNCTIISETSACFGIGLWGEQYIYIEDCELISKSYTPNIYVHDVEFWPYGGEAYFTMKNCVLRREHYGYVLMAHAILPQNTVYLTFQNVQDIYDDDAGNVKVCIDNKYHADGIGWCGLNNMFLTQESVDNTIEEMNYELGIRKEPLPECE